MATLNEFKLVNIKSKKYFSYLSPKKNVSEMQQKRLGFYYLVIEGVTQTKDINEISDCIIDNEFCKLVLDETNDDSGVDAVVIDEDDMTINLFSFKFREKFNQTAGQSSNDAAISMKFLSNIANGDTGGLTPKTKYYVEEILRHLNSDAVWTINLFMVSNENHSFPIDDKTIDGFKKTYGLNVTSINLNHVVDFMAKRPEDIKASLIVDSSSVMSYEEDELSSAKSYLIEIQLIDLIRITCTNPDLRNNHHLEKFDSIQDTKLDLGLLFDNVRGFLGDTRYNENILATLRTQPNRFFMYNNGLTMTAKSIEAEGINVNKKMLLKLNGFQIVNGGQTLRSAYAFKDQDFNEDKLSRASVLVRIFQTQDDSSLTNSIAEYTNSQNAISSADLKSVTSLQIQIEHLLKEVGILYVRKVGDTGDDNKHYDYRISMEKMAQIIYSKQGYPDRATNQKRKMFEKFYEDIFEKNLDLDLLPGYVKEYFQIHDAYKSSRYTGFEQKYLYMLYLGNTHSDIPNNIEVLEKAIRQYRDDEGISDARKLIQNAFKVKLDELVKAM